jgi:uncharacterized membrane protein
MTETHTRTWTKAITWRVIATLLAALFVDISLAIALNIIQTVAYYVHERVWLKISWGRNSNAVES